MRNDLEEESRSAEADMAFVDLNDRSDGTGHFWGLTLHADRSRNREATKVVMTWFE